MSTKINPRQIIVDHVATLRDHGTGSISPFDIGIFIALPALAGLASYIFERSMSDNVIAILVSSFSIFAGLLINVLVLIYTVSLRAREEFDEGALERDFLREIFANVSYEILVSIVIVAFLSVLSLLKDNARVAVSSVIIALSINFVLTLLMVIKRLHILLRKRLAD